MVEIDTLPQTKTAKKAYPLAQHIPMYIAYIREYPPPHPRGRKKRCRLWVSLLTQARLMMYEILNCWINSFFARQKDSNENVFPFFVLVICDAPSIVICPMFEYSKTPSTLLTLFFYVSSFLFISNTCLNPLVICWKIREVREIFANVFKHVFSKCIPSGNQWETDFRFKQLSMFACSYNQTAF